MMTDAIVCLSNGRSMASTARAKTMKKKKQQHFCRQRCEWEYIQECHVSSNSIRSDHVTYKQKLKASTWRILKTCFFECLIVEKLFVFACVLNFCHCEWCVHVAAVSYFLSFYPVNLLSQMPWDPLWWILFDVCVYVCRLFFGFGVCTTSCSVVGRWFVSFIYYRLSKH